MADEPQTLAMGLPKDDFELPREDRVSDDGATADTRFAERMMTAQI